MEKEKLVYEKPMLRFKYFVFGGNIATVSSVDSSQGGDNTSAINAGDLPAGVDLPEAWW